MNIYTYLKIIREVAMNLRELGSTRVGREGGKNDVNRV